MSHFICTGGCNGVAETPGICQAEDCPKHGEALIPCDCTDGEHHRPETDAEAEEM